MVRYFANLLLSVTVKEFWRSVRIRQSYGKKSSGTFFFRTRCSSSIIRELSIRTSDSDSICCGRGLRLPSALARNSVMTIRERFMYIQKADTEAVLAMSERCISSPMIVPAQPCTTFCHNTSPHIKQNMSSSYILSHNQFLIGPR